MQMRTWFQRAIVTAAALAVVSVSAWSADSRQVAVKEAVIRSKPMIFAKKLTTVGNGTWLEVGETRRAWVRVTLADGRSGWVQQSALTASSLELKSGSRQVETGASDEELTLAGKGFNSEVEEAFRERNRALDYRWVDRMETFAPSDEELQRFAAGGKLVPQEGDDDR